MPSVQDVLKVRHTINIRRNVSAVLSVSSRARPVEYTLSLRFRVIVSVKRLKVTFIHLLLLSAPENVMPMVTDGSQRKRKRP